MSNYESHMTEKKVQHFIKFNMDVLVTPIKVVYNDEVKDLTEAKKVLEKFTLKRIK